VKALIRFAKRQHREKLEDVEQVVSLSPLTEPTTNDTTELRLRCLGRVLGAALVRTEPVGFLLYGARFRTEIFTTQEYFYIPHLLAQSKHTIVI
jgi:hypothetical protein